MTREIVQLCKEGYGYEDIWKLLKITDKKLRESVRVFRLEIMK